MVANTGGYVKQWLDEAKEDMDLARHALLLGNLRNAVFLAHLALEKTLKALVFRSTSEPPPRIHNLSELASRTDVLFDEKKMRFLAGMDFYQLAGRYPDARRGGIDPERAMRDFHEAERILEWLIKQ
ncbi:MAG TPA: HEPN domain-containing protein [bacterium]|nr:HEPN domain-containing protein [bacterium]